MKEVEAVLLVGGKGVRMGDVSAERQKCLLPIDGQPVVLHIMRALDQAFDQVDLKVAVSHHAEQVIDFIDKNKPQSVTPTYIHDNGQGNWAAYYGMRNYVRGRFLGLAGDVFTTAKAYEDIHIEGQTTNSFMTFLLSPNHIAETHPLVRLEHGKVSELTFPVKRTDEVKSGQLRDTGIYSCDEGFFEMLQQYPFPQGDIMDSVKEALANGLEIGGMVTSERWLHVAYPEDLQKSWSYD